MKKSLLILFVLSLIQLSQAQTYDNLFANVWSSPGVGVSNQRVWIRAYNGGAIIKNSTGFTDSFGTYRDSISTLLTLDSVVSFTYDCNGLKLKGIAGPLSAPNGWGYEDTIYQTCPMTSLSGTAGFVYTQSTSQANVINFSDNSVGSGIPTSKTQMFCFFGDNDSSIVGANFSHTYPGPGKYYVQYSYSEFDTIGDYSTQDWYRDTIEVLPFVPGGFCQASYWVDTLNSGNNVALIYNTSTPSQKDTNYVTTYHWDFGDGDTSNLAFPTHTYASAGAYGVCLTVKSIDTAGAFCTSMFCDTLGIDTTGNLIYKGSGFTLQVLNPALGINEITVREAFDIYPNPVNEFLIIKSSIPASVEVKYSLYDIGGSELVNGVIEKGSSQVQVNVNHLKAGVYLLKMSTKGKPSGTYKVMKR